MGRRSTIDEARVFAVVGHGLARRGTLILQDVVGEAGVSIGSLYHRYESREGLLARAFIDAVRAFQTQVMPELEGEGVEAVMAAACAVPAFCRAEPDRAVILSCCRQSEFLTEATPEPLRSEIETVNAGAAQAIAEFAARNGFGMEALRLALVGLPLGAVRLYLPGRPVPEEVDARIAAAVRAILA
ncbi:TetR/AcrR family transcriptional regulator [Pontivivens ytuae]|uniref:TetR/AcrR family transcriptional regulator n=1 Tax=Pontivivens ytuae TaxID=2789856 RepID=A0A7S9LSA7_9RHOB|nr:TetR/AcrR family transcriptional regulator [Pontivivens ytuae]QPH54389.1 TetR/AcrR family transcriptional regulator [Pontivivens ytuae]